MSRSCGQPAAWIAGTTWRATPAARARAITSSRSRSNSPASTWQWLSTSMASVPAAGLALDGFAAPWPYPLPVGQQQRAEPEQQLVDAGNHVRHEDIADEQRRGQQEQLGIAQPAEPAHQGGEQGIGHARFPFGWRGRRGGAPRYNRADVRRGVIVAAVSSGGGDAPLR